MEKVELLDAALIARTLDAAKASPRRRINHNFHSDPGDALHRFLNVLLEGTYVRPHRHRAPPKPEAFVVLEGTIALFLFDDDGRVRARHDLGGGGARGIDLEPGLWHSIAPTSAHAVVYEVKPGPWDPSTDKELAPWAPPEGAPEVHAYLAGLLAQHPR